jgi:hypothetical protein
MGEMSGRTGLASWRRLLVLFRHLAVGGPVVADSENDLFRLWKPFIMRFGCMGIMGRLRRPRLRAAHLGRVALISFVVLMVLSPAALGVWRRYDISKIARQYQSLIEEGSYQEAHSLARRAAEFYPKSKLTKHMIAQSRSLLTWVESFWDMAESLNDEPFAITPEAEEWMDSET